MERNTFVVRRKSDDVQHWKYIRRIPGANGKWKYIYEDSGIYGPYTTKGKIKDKLGYDERAAYKEINKAHKKALVNANTDRAFTKDGRPTAYSRYQVHNTKKVREQALKEYQKTPLGKLETAANKGKKILNRLLGIH